MKKFLAFIFACLLTFGAVAGELVQLPVPRLGPGDDYTYAMCFSAVVDADGSLWLAATVGRLVVDDWGNGYEQVRLYHYTESGVTGEVVYDNRWDGSGGIFEACQLSLTFFDGEPLIAATVSIVPGSGSPSSRFGVVGEWYRSNGRWQQYVPIVGHSWEYGRGTPWAARWVGDPILFDLDGLALSWCEQTDSGLVQWIAYPGPPGAPVVWKARIAVLPGTYLHDIAWDSDGSAVALLGEKNGDKRSPWGVAKSPSEYPGTVFGQALEYWGPDDAWGHNPTFVRTPDSRLAGRAIAFESTCNLESPAAPAPGHPVEYCLWLWGDPLPPLPGSVGSRYASWALEVRRVQAVR